MALIAAGLNCTVADLLGAKASECVLIGADDMDPVHEALAVLGSVLIPPK
jgi:hypothetical protein